MPNELLFKPLEANSNWLANAIYLPAACIFHTIARLGRTVENPFEGTANDVPIVNIARRIEIDLRQNLGETKKDIPSQFDYDYGLLF